MFVHLHHDYIDSGERLFHVASPQAGADAWLANAQANEGKWSTNLQNTTKSITGRAIQQKTVMVNNFTASVNDGTWENNLARVGDAGVKAAAKAKAPNYGTGIGASKDKYLAYAQKAYPYISSGQDMVDSMPKGTIAQAKARANAWIDYMHAGKGQF